MSQELAAGHAADCHLCPNAGTGREMLQTLSIHPCSSFPCILPTAALSCPQQQAELAPALCSPSDGSCWDILQPEPQLNKTWGPAIWGQPEGQAVPSAGVTSAGQLEQS